MHLFHWFFSNAQSTDNPRGTPLTAYTVSVGYEEIWLISTHLSHHTHYMLQTQKYIMVVHLNKIYTPFLLQQLKCAAKTISRFDDWALYILQIYCSEMYVNSVSSNCKLWGRHTRRLAYSKLMEIISYWNQKLLAFKTNLEDEKCSA